jgi:hypothetical protein
MYIIFRMNIYFLLKLSPHPNYWFRCLQPYAGFSADMRKSYFCLVLAASCHGDDDASRSLTAASGFRLSNSERSCGFVTIETGGDGNSDGIFDFLLEFGETSTSRLGVLSRLGILSFSTVSFGVNCGTSGVGMNADVGTCELESS